MHYIQKHILKTLMYTRYARFRDMRPPKVDSNAYSYHLRSLLKGGLIKKEEQGYCLTPAGLFHVDRVSMGNLEPRMQPKIITMVVVKNSSGSVLLYSKLRQPFIGSNVLPFGKVHLEDRDVDTAATRELKEKAGLELTGLQHRGDCYVYVSMQGQMVSSVMAHIFSATVDVNVVDQVKYSVSWFDEAERSQIELGPAVEEIIRATESKEEFFFKTFAVDWLTRTTQDL